jgi:hypothetical protein
MRLVGPERCIAFSEMEELKSKLAELEAGALDSLRDEDYLKIIRQLHAGIVISAPVVPVRTLIYRAVKVTQRPANKSRISYPPASAVKTNGRCSRAGEVMFYGALNQFLACLQECSWQLGDFFAISAWLTKEPNLFNHLGFSKEVLESFKANRQLPITQSQRRKASDTFCYVIGKRGVSPSTSRMERNIATACQSC